MICPHCENEIDRVYISAPAVVETIALVNAEVTFAEWRETLRHEPNGRGYLAQFRLDEILETLERNENHYGLEIDDDRAEFYCPECDKLLERALVQAEVDREKVTS